MKINTSVIISAIALAVGLFLNEPYLWVPLSVLIAGLIDLSTRQWVISDRLGSAQRFSILLKFFFATIGFYAMLGQILCIALVVWWFI